MDHLTDNFWPANNLTAWQMEPARTFDEWMATQSAIRGRQYRQDSLATYKFYFESWVKFLQARRCGLLEATSAEAEAFFNSKNLDAVSRRRYLQLIDRVYRSLKKIGWEGQNPMAIELRKERALQPSEPESLSDDDVAKLWQALKLIDGWKGDRDRAMAALLLCAGLRSNEIIALPWVAVGHDYRVHIQPAGVHRAHVSIIMPGQARDFWTCWERDHIALGVRSAVAFPSSKAGRLYSESGIHRRIDTWLEMANINVEERGVMLLRNTFARLALQRYSPSEVQEFLGHEDLRSTLRHGEVHLE